MHCHVVAQWVSNCPVALHMSICIYACIYALHGYSGIYAASQKVMMAPGAFCTVAWGLPSHQEL